MPTFLALLSLLCAASFVQAQNIEGQPIASQYGIWRVQGYAPNTYTNFAPTSCKVQGGQSFFFAFTIGTPVKIVDGNPSLSEIVTPTALVNTNDNCSIKIAPRNKHQLPWYITSATGGLQEALQQNATTPGANTIILDNNFYQLAGPSNVASVIASVRGYATLGLVDITQTPYVWYEWNGSQYVPISSGAGGCAPQYSIQFYLTSASFGCDSEITIDPITHTVTAAGGFTVPGSGTGTIKLAGISSGGIVTQTVDPSTGTWTDTVPTSAPSSNGLCRVATTAGVESWSVCSPGAGAGWYTTLATSMGASDTTATLAAAPPVSSGTFYIDQEWMMFTGVSGNTLTGLTRGYSQTTAATHNSGTPVISVDLDFTSTSQLPNGGFFGGGLSIPPILGVNVVTPNFHNASAVADFNVGSSEMYILSDGGIIQSDVATTSPINSLGTTVIGNYTIRYSGTIEDSINIAQWNQQNQFYALQGFGAGIAGPLYVQQPTTIPAPTLENAGVPSGSSTLTYLCSGTDIEGNTIPGTGASLTNVASSWSSGAIIIACPVVPGVQTYTIWRTAGGPDQGSIGSGGPTVQVYDFGGSVTPGTPPMTNTSIPQVCIGPSTGGAACWSSGATAPTGICQTGSLYSNTAGTAGSTFYSCVAGAWADIN